MRRLTAAALAGLLLLGMAGASATADETDDKVDSGKSRIAVGIRTAHAKGGDTRGKFDYVLPRGGVIQDWVAVSNLRYEPVTVRLFAKDATSSGDSNFSIQASEAAPKGLGSWIGIKETTLTIPPRTESIVPFQLGVPPSATPGDHAGAVVVSLRATEKKPEGGTIVLDHRVAMRVYLRVPGDLEADLAIQDLKVDWTGETNLLGRGDAKVTYKVTNTGNVRISGSGRLSLSRVLGLPPITTSTPEVDELLPGGSLEVTQTLPNVFGAGPMKATVSLNGKPADPTIAEVETSATTSFFAFPWLLFALVVAVITLCGAGGWFERRRRARRRAGSGGGAHAAAKEKSVAEALVRGAIVALAVVGLAVMPRPANAAEVPEWTATPVPQSGTDLTPINVLTSGGCPLPGTNILGMGWGKGFPKEGAMVMGNTEAGVYQDQPIEAGLYATLRQVMFEQPEPVPFQGDYRIEIRCVSPGVDIISGKYVFTLRFIDAHNWHFVEPGKETPGPNITTSDQPKAGGDPSAVAEPTPTPGADPTQSPEAETGSTETAAPEPQLSAAEERAAELSGTKESASKDSESSGPWPLYVGGLAALLALAAYFGVRRTKA